ncbi:uncharacterized protein LOC124248356 [Equus quagga]|uniref:uncharacterized protein LOC124248356 n=1 Tax=Equus quagga TaxID=89248 RepID=UPI001EE27E4D|nr:uncharacterized protein LOC124248356 [Equus quagga]
MSKCWPAWFSGLLCPSPQRTGSCPVIATPPSAGLGDKWMWLWDLVSPITSSETSGRSRNWPRYHFSHLHRAVRGLHVIRYEETEAQRSYVTCLWSRSKGQNWNSKLGNLACDGRLVLKSSICLAQKAGLGRRERPWRRAPNILLNKPGSETRARHHGYKSDETQTLTSRTWMRKTGLNNHVSRWRRRAWWKRWFLGSTSSEDGGETSSNW